MDGIITYESVQDGKTIFSDHVNIATSASDEKMEPGKKVMADVVRAALFC